MATRKLLEIKILYVTSVIEPKELLLPILMAYIQAAKLSMSSKSALFEF